MKDLQKAYAERQTELEEEQKAQLADYEQNIAKAVKQVAILVHNPDDEDEEPLRGMEQQVFQLADPPKQRQPRAQAKTQKVKITTTRAKPKMWFLYNYVYYGATRADVNRQGEATELVICNQCGVPLFCLEDFDDHKETTCISWLAIKKEQAAKKLEDLKHKFERMQQRKASWVKLKPQVQMIPGEPPYLEEDPDATMEYDLDDVTAYLATERKTRGERIKELQVKLQENLDMDDQKDQAEQLNEVVQDIAHVTKQVDVLKQKHKEAKKKQEQQQEAKPQEQQEAEPQEPPEQEPMYVEPFTKDQPAAASSSHKTLHDPEMVARLAALKDSPHASPEIKHTQIRQIKHDI